MQWQTILFHEAPPTLVDTTKQIMKDAGYRAYDPFPGGLGAPIGKVTRTRMFLAPMNKSWTRLLVAPGDVVDDALIASIVVESGVAAIWPQLLDDGNFTFRYASASGINEGDWSAFEPYLRDDKSVTELESAAGQMIVVKSNHSALPDDIQQMAADQGIGMGQVDKMMGKMTRRMFGKDGQADAMQKAQAGLANQQKVNWASIGGQRLQAVMACLAIEPDEWREPTWEALTAAYQIARQRDKGQADLLATDAAALDAVPNALDYQLLYFSKKQ